jgi:DEAD/DEAH box helicase domain-containing protein
LIDWTIEPQVQIDARFRGLPRKRVDFLLTPVWRGGGLPVVIEMDGIEYHAGTVAQDLLDRMLMIRSGRVWVWTLSWRGLDPENKDFLNPLSKTALGTQMTGLLERALAHPLPACGGGPHASDDQHARCPAAPARRTATLTGTRRFGRSSSAAS